MPVKYWDGSQFVELSKSQVQAYDGSAFAEVADASYYDGGAFQSLFSTTTTNVVDDFEDGDLAEYGGDTGNFTVQTATVSNGSNALEVTSESGNLLQGISSTSGLDRYPAQGETFACDVYITSDTNNVRIYWGTQSEIQDPDGYFVMLQGSQDNIELGVGGGSTLDSVNATFPTGEWLTATITWGTDGSMSVDVTDASGTTLASVSGTDTTYTSGGIGFWHNTSSAGISTYWDHYRIV